MRTGGPWPQQRRLLVRVEDAFGGGAQDVRVRQNSVEDLLGGEFGPHLIEDLRDGPAPGDLILDAVVGGFAAPFHLHQDLVGEPLGQSSPSAAVAGGAPQGGGGLADLMVGEPVAVHAAGDDEAVLGFADMRPQGLADDVRHPRVAFEGGHGSRFLPHGGAEQVADRGLLDADLTQGG